MTTSLATANRRLSPRRGAILQDNYPWEGWAITGEYIVRNYQDSLYVSLEGAKN